MALSDTIASSLLDELSLEEISHTGGVASAFLHPEVNQAVGMIAVQLNVSVAVALSRLRVTAYSSDKLIWWWQVTWCIADSDSRTVGESD
ncbi:hypothetical protein R4P64_24030 [Rhodococcus sp. IEGM 1366]|uniref:hypothetical protein n=1 Tax=Rhodococcus sp. IEGM 1366 TaxID=3082223 RepID=UPI002953D214|nr:hypothetical protein [Rhodococcus sp. IEGM 1366]MDV8069602.1 hypothetical protein [Rhodococcus sp. IEGM 1366]